MYNGCPIVTLLDFFKKNRWSEWRSRLAHNTSCTCMFMHGTPQSPATEIPSQAKQVLPWKFHNKDFPRCSEKYCVEMERVCTRYLSFIRLFMGTAKFFRYLVLFVVVLFVFSSSSSFPSSSSSSFLFLRAVTTSMSRHIAAANSATHRTKKDPPRSLSDMAEGPEEEEEEEDDEDLPPLFPTASCAGVT